MGTLYRESSLNQIPSEASFDNSYWHYFLILEKDFKETLNYVHLDEANLKTFSFEFAKLLVNISTEFETICKLICKEIDGSSSGNIKEYKETILNKFPKIWSTPVYIDKASQTEIHPLKKWETVGGRLEWWNAYNNIKHERHKYFEEATLKNSLYALGGLLILEVYLYKIAYKNNSAIRYGTTLMRVPGMAEAGYMQKDDLLTQIEQGKKPIIIDVRSSMEYDSGHVPSAIHLPFWTAFTSDLMDAYDKDTPVVLYCEHGPRAGIAKLALSLSGFQTIRYLDGHMTAWRQLGLPIEVSKKVK